MNAAFTLVQVNAAQRYVPVRRGASAEGNISHISTTSTMIPPNWC
jgi:hypothetical protein